MASGIDILHLFPDLAAIGQQQMREYCNEWLQRPIAREYALAQIIVDDKLRMHISVDASRPVLDGDRAFIPIDKLLGYIVDQHFQDAEKRQELHASVREARQRWAELNREYEVAFGRMGTLYLTRKNPECQAELETEHRAREGQEIICKPTDVTCPFCGATHTYDGRDFHLGLMSP